MEIKALLSLSGLGRAFFLPSLVAIFSLFHENNKLKLKIFKSLS